MKNFAFALLVFILWGTASMFYLRLKYNVALSTANESLSRTGFSNEHSSNRANVAPLYPDNTQLSTEMERVVTRIKTERSRKEATTIIKNQVLDTSIPELQIDMLFPEFKYKDLMINQNLIDYGLKLERKIAKNPQLQITIVGHYYEEQTSLDNYLEALTRAKLLKSYLVEHFRIPSGQTCAISEGESRPLSKINKGERTDDDPRIEVITEVSK